jgi:organic radical activating enzyme
MQKTFFSLLGVMILNKCNLRCKGCTSFSDYENHNVYDTDVIIKGLEFWSTKIDVESINITGGEPFLHPDLEHIIRTIRKLWPNAMIDLITNGTYITKRPEILDLLHSLGHCALKFSQHQIDKPYTKQAENFILSRYDWEPCEFRSDWLQTNNRFYVFFSPEENFLSPVKGNYGQVKPHFNDPSKAFQVCCFGNGGILDKTSLYKCYPLALLKTMLTDFNQQDDPDWQQYLDYKPLTMDHTQEEFENFLKRLSGPESECSMCPSSAQSPGSMYKKRGQWSSPIIPINTNVVVKKP